MFKIGKDCKIHKSVQINVNEGKIDDRTVIAEGVKIEGRHIYIGKESFINRALSNVINKMDDPLGKKRGSLEK